MSFIFHKTIRFRIAFISYLIFLAVSLLAAIVIYFSIRSLLQQATYRQTEAQAYALLDRIEINPVFIPLPEEEEAAKILVENADTSYTLFISPAMKPINTDQENYFGENPIVSVSKNIDSENTLTVFFFLTQKELADTLRQIRWVLGAFIVVSSLISAWMSYWAGRLFLQPIRNITNATRSISLSEKPEMIPVQLTHDEIQYLTETFNQMLVRIGKEVEKQNHFFASASHELRTPLAILQSEIEVTLRSGDLPDKFENLLDNQLLEIKRLSNLVEDFLMVSTLKNPDLQIFTTSVALDEILLEVVDRYTKLIHRQGLSLNISLDPKAEDFLVKGDSSKLKTAMGNLIENAIKYTPVENEITICLIRNGMGGIMLSFENHFEKSLSDLDKLTKAFYQTDVLNNGYGMGLWISKKIFDLHKADLMLKHQNSKFTACITFEAS